MRWGAYKAFLCVKRELGNLVEICMLKDIKGGEIMAVKEELKVVVGAEGYNNNPGWLHTQEGELNLLKGQIGRKSLLQTL